MAVRYRWAMPHRLLPATLGRGAALCWLAVGLLLLRMATNGSFIDLALDDTPASRAVLDGVSAVLALLALVLAGSLAGRPRRGALVVSVAAGLLMTPVALPLLAVNHFSAVALPPLGLLAAVLSTQARRDLGASAVTR